MQSRTEWEKFQLSNIWKGFLFDLEEREKYLVELFKDSDQLWSSDTIRGKLTELEYFKNIPKSIIASLIIKEINDKGDNNELHSEENVRQDGV